MTDKSLSERLRERSHIPTCIEVADALDQKDAEIERLRAALQRIDGINDSPACFNPMIEEVLRRVLEPTP